jgi:chaperonin cofactor prefoldin
MSERKVVGRNVVITVGIIAIILLVGLVGAIANYTSIINNKDSTIQTKESQIQTLTNQKNQLQTWLDGNKTLLSQTQTWLDGNKTLLTQTQTWLTGNLTLINTLNTQITNLQDQISGLNSQISSLNAQITDLQNQIDTLKAPKLIKVNLRADDNRPFLGTPYLHVYGYVCNVGTNTAYNSKIHVVAYQSGGVVAIDTYIILGTISGESWTSVDASPTYGGGALTGWTLTLEWTTS